MTAPQHRPPSTVEIISQNFGPFETHICVAEFNLLKAVGSLAVLAEHINPLAMHPDFEQDSKLLLGYEDPKSPLRPLRFGGPLEYAVRDMCARNMFDRANLEEFLRAQSAFVGPLLFRNPQEDHLPRMTHEVTVYLAASEL